MDKLKSFVRLDFATVKPYLAGKNTVIFAVMALFMTAMSGSITSGIFVGMMIGTLMFSYPFVVSEKSNLDALYVTLSVNRKTVVLGRYVFTFLLNVCIIIFVIILSSAGLLATRIIGDGGDGVSDTIWMGLMLAALFAVVQAIQLPVYFKYNYSKAKIICLVPFAVIMAGFVGITTLAKDNETINRAFGLIGNISTGWFIAYVVLALVPVLFASYKISLAFYKKREF